MIDWEVRDRKCPRCYAGAYNLAYGTYYPGGPCGSLDCEWPRNLKVTDPTPSTPIVDAGKEAFDLLHLRPSPRR